MKQVITLMILALAISGAFSQTVEVQAMGEVNMKDATGKSIPIKEVVESATLMAQLKAVEQVISRSADTIRQQYAERVGDLEERKKVIVQLVTDKTIDTLPRTNLSTPRMRVYLRGKIDMTALKDQLNLWPKVVNKVDRSDVVMALFFTVQSTIEIRSSKGSETKREKSGATEESGSEEINESGLTVNERIVESDSTRVDNISIDSADQSVYKSDDQLKANWGENLLDQFNDKGFEETVDGSFFDVSEKLDDDINNRGKISAKTLRTLVPEVREADLGVELLILGRLDFSKPTRDAVSGMWAAQATMTGKIYSVPLKGVFPKTVAALGSIQRKALGKTQEDAKKSVLAIIAPLGADEIISKLKNKGRL